MDIDSRIQNLIDQIEALNYDVVLTGGFVRDQHLNQSSVDYDLATNAPLELISKLFKHSRELVLLDKLVMLHIDLDGLHVELSRFREEYYDQDYNLESIDFTHDYNKDVLRRDFTMNAIGWNQEYYDPLNGIDDLNHQTLKVIGNPLERFQEDPLRILRALRFISDYNLNVDKETLNAIQVLYPLSLTVSNSEHELKKILKGKYFDKVYDLIPELFTFISDAQFINLNQSKTRLDTDLKLLIYLIYDMRLSLINPIFDFLIFSKKDLEFLLKSDDVIQDLRVERPYEDIVECFIHFGQDMMLKLYDNFKDFTIIDHENLKMIQEVYKNGYIRIDELELDVSDIPFNISIKEKYDLLKELQLLVVCKHVKNKRELLLDVLYNNY